MFEAKIRYPSEKVMVQAEKIIGSKYFTSLLEDIPLMMVIINSARQIVYANQIMIKNSGAMGNDALIGLRPGECVGCVNAVSCEYGCGSAEFCKVCGLANAILSCEEGMNGENECTISLPGGKTLLFFVRTRAFVFEGESFVFCTMQDISDRKSHELLEKIFLHDIQNSAAVLLSLHEVIDIIDEDELKSLLNNVSANLNEDIQSYRMFLEAEKGRLMVKPQSILLDDTIRAIIKELANIKSFRDSIIQYNNSGIRLTTDVSLLRRVITNLLKNALEASGHKEQIYISASKLSDNIKIEVKSFPLINDEIKLRLFQKTVTSKGKGRGWGTYSVKLLVESYLNGSVSFISDEIHRTIFSVVLPIQI